MCASFRPTASRKRAGTWGTGCPRGARAGRVPPDPITNPARTSLRAGVRELAAQIAAGVVHDLEPSQRHRAWLTSATYSDKISTVITPLDSKLLPLTRCHSLIRARRASGKP